MKLDGVIALLELGNKTRFDAFVSQRLSNFGHLGGAGRGSACTSPRRGRRLTGSARDAAGSSAELSTAAAGETLAPVSPTARTLAHGVRHVVKRSPFRLRPLG